MNKNNKKIELLAPAGDLTRLRYALAYGADAVYLGLPEFSLRAKTGLNFETLKQGIKEAHSQKKKVFVTVNVFAHENHLKILPEFLKKLKVCNPDAIILSDPGVLNLVKKYLPKTAIHLSTQANTLNSEAVKFWQKNGVKRIILGREASLEDIKKIHSVAPKMELEMFVHGAMCLSYSGRCYLSAELSKRSANLGECSQPCRWPYKMYAEETVRPGRLFEIEEDGKNMYFMNSQDLCLIDYLVDLVKAGVMSFKIEGRTKSQYYVACVTRAYRKALDAVSLPFTKGEVRRGLLEAKNELLKIDNRGYTIGFLVPTESMKRQNYETSKAKSDWQVVGEVVGQKNNQIEIRIHNSFKIGDDLELLTPAKIHQLKIKRIHNKLNENMAEVHGGTQETYFIGLPKGIDAKLGLLRKKLNK